MGNKEQLNEKELSVKNMAEGKKLKKMQKTEGN
jgi:hypothetical protein